LVGPKRRLQPERVGDIHVKIGAMIRDIMDNRRMNEDDWLYWVHRPFQNEDDWDEDLKGYFTGMPRKGQEIEIVKWIRGSNKELLSDPIRKGQFNSRAQEIIVGILDVDAPSSRKNRVAGEVRIIIAYPGNMFGLPIDSWVMQEYQGPAVHEDELQEDYFQWRYHSADVFLQERSIVWVALKNWVQKVWRSVQDEKLELSVNRSPKRVEKLNWPYSFKVNDFADPETLKELRLSRMHTEYEMDEYESNQEIANWGKWLWTIVPSNHLDAEGTVTTLVDGTPVILGEFSSCNLVVAIGGIAPRWLGTRTINWSLPFPLIPWTDPLE
jgi:hypothetical protein